jgi:glutaredoxin
LVLNTLIKTLILYLFMLLLPQVAHSGEGRFVLVPQGGTVRFEATCFDTEATAKLLTWKEFLAKEMKTQCEFEKRALVLDSELVIKNMQITLDETQVRYQVEIDTRDKEIETLRDIIKKNKKLNIPVVVATSVAVGFGVGFGTYHFASK